jgi:hypothetical protein
MGVGILAPLIKVVCVPPVGLPPRPALPTKSFLVGLGAGAGRLAAEFCEIRATIKPAFADPEWAALPSVGQ